MIDVKLTDQTRTFLCSLLSGVLLGAVYILFKCLRTSWGNRKIPTVVCDVLFMLFFTVITCLFSIGFTDGFVRYYVVAGEIAGLFVFKLTLGVVVYKLYELIFKLISRINRFIQKNISVFLKKLLKAWHKMLYNKVSKKAKSAN
ncbi:MAG: spore cortex biosynthesis protein YabQ [Clostridia bacterium]|nr:spore cortex biosynthesis protein YabQ [Clostridia bacterium]